MLEVRLVGQDWAPGTEAIPVVDRQVTVNDRLVARLDTAVRESRLVVVAAESGSGKTSLVSGWARRARARGEIRWHGLRPAAATGRDQEPADDLLGRRSPYAHLRVIRPDERRVDRRAGATPAPRVVVLDDFPVDPDDATQAALAHLLRRTDLDVCVILACPAMPRLDHQRLGLTAGPPSVGSLDLALDPAQIEAVLLTRGIEPSPDLVTAIGQRTSGWAWGVQAAAGALAGSSEETAALDEAERQIGQYLEDSVLRGLSGRDRDLITATSLVRDVTPELVAAILGDRSGLPTEVVERSHGFVRLRADASFRLHPLLRRHLGAGLLRQPARAHVIARRAAEHLVGQGDLDAAIDAAGQAGDWCWAARTTVESLRIPRLLAAPGDDPLGRRPGAVAGLAAAEPLIEAAVALGRCWPDVARRVLQDAAGRSDEAGSGAVAAELSDCLVRMVLARWEADSATGLRHHRRAAALLPRLSATQRADAPVLVPLLQAHLAAFESCDGAIDRARIALERGARSFRTRPLRGTDPGTQAAAADCLGQLAWLEALSGELTSALRHAAEVLTAQAADSHESGVVHAQLATAWCHLSRGEVAQASQRLSSVIERHLAPADGTILPELAVASAITATRVAAVLGYGRVGHEIRQLCQSSAYVRQFEHHVLVIRAEAELDRDEPAAALQLLGEGTQQSADLYALRARAWIQLGDLASVATSLRNRPVEPVTPMTRVQLQLIEGWLARAHGDGHRQRALVDRALHTAGREQLRAPIAWAKPWLYDVIAADPVLLRRHGTFLASISGVRLEQPVIPCRPAEMATISSALTAREIDILQRLGALSTNEEIAADLFLSPNTVKTHLKSLYRKLEVSRRSEAFRRGRALGLC